MNKLIGALFAGLTLSVAVPVMDVAEAHPPPIAEVAKASPEALVRPSYHHWSYAVERWHQTALNAGWPDSAWYRLSQIIYRESRGQPYVWNRRDCCGGSIGLTQINGTHWNWLMRAGIIRYPWDLTNAYRNLRAARALYNRAGWSPWY